MQQEGYDVYVYEPEPLNEGEEKHVISVFVADESGLINRVAGVFARRGANIESLAVGLNIDKALFTVVLTGTANTVANLVKQLSKLVKVRIVEDITAANRLERELILLKVNAPDSETRTELVQLAEIFRARIVDVSDRTATISLTGDPGKNVAFQKVVSRFGIAQIARTGRICLKRGEELLGSSAEDLQGAGTGEGDTVVPPKNGTLPLSLMSRDADVYPVDKEEEPGVWEVKNVLEASYGGEQEETPDFQAHTLSLEVTDVPGVLNQVTGVFARRGYNVQSLAVGPSEKEGQSRITMVVPGSPQGIANLLKQVSKLVNVTVVTDLTPAPFVNRELMLVKVRCTPAQRLELRNVVDIFRGTICDISSSTAMVEVQGKAAKMKALNELLEPFGILEVARTGRVALPRESGVDSRYLARTRSGRVW